MFKNLMVFVSVLGSMPQYLSAADLEDLEEGRKVSAAHRAEDVRLWNKAMETVKALAAERKRGEKLLPLVPEEESPPSFPRENLDNPLEWHVYLEALYQHKINTGQTKGKINTVLTLPSFDRSNGPIYRGFLGGLELLALDRANVAVEFSDGSISYGFFELYLLYYSLALGPVV